MPGLPNYDYDSEQTELLRRLKVAQAMQEGGLAPLPGTEVVSGVAVKKSPLEAIAKVAQAYFGNKMATTANEGQKALAERYQDDLKSGVSNLIEGLSAQPGQATAVNDESGGHSGPAMDVAGAQKAKRDAILGAIGSGHPVLQQLGMSQLSKTMNPDQMTMKDWLALGDKFDPVSVLKAAQGGGPSVLAPKKEKPLEVAGMLIDPTTHTVIEANGPVPKQVTIGGDLYEINPTTKQYKKLDNAPKVTTTNHITVPVNVKGEGKFMEKLGESSAEDIIKARQSSVDAQRTIQSMQKLEQLDKQGVFTGPTAQPAMIVGSLAEALGLPVDKAKLANSQSYQGELMGNLSNVLTGSLARSTTDKDVQILMAPLPQLLNSVEGRAALRRQAIAKAQERIAYSDQVQQNLLQKFPEAARLIQTTPGNPGGVPMRSDVAPGKPTVSNW